MKRTGTMKIKDILRHRHDLALPRAQIAAAVGVSTGTVSHVLARAEAAGLSWPLPEDLDDEALKRRLYPAPGPDGDRVQPDWDAVIEALTAPRKRRRARLTRRQLWVEYRDEVLAQEGKPYTYSRFCALLGERLGSRPAPAQMRLHYAPGLWGLSDFSGKTLGLRTGRGEKDVEIFVAVLAHSNRIYAEAVPDQRVRHWIMAHRRAFEYFGGVPSRWIIDNLKAGVDKPDREESRLNPSFREFARHSGGAVLPGRSGRATDKGLVEACVGAVQSRIRMETTAGRPRSTGRPAPVATEERKIGRLYEREADTACHGGVIARVGPARGLKPDGGVDPREVVGCCAEPDGPE